ncbi:proline-specific peptidase [Exidia glandulosa HHB12029]|uniref:Proline-specific peptidase n=1 Tax=Exidia glandulosa HHB12029 TaxID=1314781 RepID=A0A165H4F3_EXIGL|nr:proline-specific peptidase [Exidia glandulosa HHB12029]
MSVPVTTGEVDFDVPSAGKACKTWYEIHGDITSARPLVILHGGPGICHYYVSPMANLASTHGIPVILYDQLGCGNSTHLPEKKGDEGFWTVQLFLDELDNLLIKLNIAEYDLLGHSWGGMLGSEHAVRKPKGLRRLILSSSISSMELWLEAADRLRKQLPKDVQDTLEKYEDKEEYEAPEYLEAVNEFYNRFVCRVQPPPEELSKSMEDLEKDNTVYFTMNGPNEFRVIGPIKDWTIIDRAHLIDVPTLLTNGQYDEAQNSVILPFFERIPNVTWIKFPNSSHTAQLEEPERFLQVIGGFLSA